MTITQTTQSKVAMDEVDKFMQSGIADGVFPGAVLQVVSGGRTVFEKAFGVADLFSGQPMNLETYFDLASLTKPLATVPAIMVLVERGRLDLDQSIGSVCVELSGSDKANLTVRQMLTHSSGLPPWRPFFMRLRHVPQRLRLGMLRKFLLEEPLVYEPGRSSEYSDLGFMFLQWVVETISGQPLDRFVSREIYTPLGIGELFFNDSFTDVVNADAYAAAQLCPWRGLLLKGHVDDDNAYAIGGVAGHAGLFGTVGAVTYLLQALMAAEQGTDERGVFNPRWVSTFFAAPENRRWALGFDTPSSRGSSSGHCFASNSVGHLGFTGTSFWMDRSKGVIVVLLTNRVHPFRFNAGIKAFRPGLHDAVMAALGFAGGQGGE